jgi:hypothetical protein
VYKLFCAELHRWRRSFEDFFEKFGYRRIQHRIQRSESGKCVILKTVFNLQNGREGGGGGLFIVKVG